MKRKSNMDIIVYLAVVYGLTLACHLSGNRVLLTMSQITPLIGTISIFIFFPNRKETWKQLGLERVGKLRWYMVALLAGVPVMLSFLGAWATGFVDLPPASNFPGGIDGQGGRFLLMVKYFLNPITLLFPVIAALGEEIGWRGFLQSRFMETAGVKKTFVYTGLIWAVFHYPFYLNDYNDVGNVWVNMALFTLTLIPLSIVMGWIRMMSQSLWPVVLFHAVINHQRFFWEQVFYVKQKGWNYLAGEAAIFSLLLWSVAGWGIWKYLEN